MGAYAGNVGAIQQTGIDQLRKLVFIENDEVVTDSLTVAEMFGKEHKNVLRDINTQIEYAGKDFSQLNFELSEYEVRGKQYPKFNLTEEAFTLVVFGYNTKEAVQTKIKFIQEFKRMKAELQKNFKLPSTYKEALIQLVESVEENEKLQTQNLVLEQRVSELKPKATYYDLVLQNKSLLSVSQIAKDYGFGAPTLNRKLQKHSERRKSRSGRLREFVFEMQQQGIKIERVVRNVQLTVGEMLEFTNRLKDIQNNAGRSKDVQLACFMSDLEANYNIPMCRNEEFEKKNKFLMMLYRTVSESRSI